MKKIFKVFLLLLFIAVTASAQTNIGPPRDTVGSKVTNKLFGSGGQFNDTLIAKLKFILDQLRGNGTKLIGVDNTGTVVLTSIDTSGYTSVTVSQMRALMAAKTVRPSRIYNITNVDIPLYGGTSIFVVGTSDTTISNKGQGIFYNPRYNQAVTGYGVWNQYGTFAASSLSGKFTVGENITSNTAATGTLLVSVGTGTTYFVPTGGTWAGSTSITGATSGRTATIASVTVPSYSIGASVIWGGKKWTNVNGNVGAATDLYTLDAEWSAVAFNRTSYNVVSNDIEYDINDDKIIARKDRSDNEVKMSYWVHYDAGTNLNPIKAFQWGNDLDTNSYKGIGVNHIIDSYLECINFKGFTTRQVSLYQGCVASGNIFLNTSYMQQVTMTNNCTFSGNINTSNSGFFQITLNNSSSVASNKLSGNSARIQNVVLNNGSSIISNIITNASSFLYFNLDKLTTVSTNNVNNTSFFRNINASVASISLNTLDNTTNINHINADNGNVTSNFLDNSSTIDYMWIMNGSLVTLNRLDASSSLNYITLDNVSRITQDTLNAGSIFRYGTMDRAANIQTATYSATNLISFNLHGSNDINRLQRGLSGINVVMDNCVDIGNSKSIVVNNSTCKEVQILNKGATGAETVSNCNLDKVVLDFANFTGCTISNVNAHGRTFTFTSNNQTISNEYWFNDKRIDTLVAGTNVTITRNVNGIYVINSSGGGGGGSITLNNTVFVSKNGDDGTGTRNRLDLPFLTVNAAASAARPNDAVVVYPGLYEELNAVALDSNISYMFLGQGTLRLITGATDDELFTEGGISDTCFIDGPGWVFESTEYQNILHPQEGSIISMVAKTLKSNAVCIYSDDDNNNLTIKADLIQSFDDYATIAQLGGRININAGTIRLESSGEVILIDRGHLYLTADIVMDTANGSGCIKSDNLLTTDSVFIDVKRIVSGRGTGWTVWMDGASKHVHINSGYIEGRGSCQVVSAGSTKVIANVNEIHNLRDGTGGLNPRGLYNAEATSEMWGIGTKFTVETSAGSVVYSFGGNLHLIGCTADSSNDYRRNGGTIDRVDNYFYSGINARRNITLGDSTNFIVDIATGDSVKNCIIQNSVIDYNGHRDCKIAGGFISNSKVSFNADSVLLTNMNISDSSIVEFSDTSRGCIIIHSQTKNVGAECKFIASTIDNTVINVNAHTDFLFSSNIYKGQNGTFTPNNAEIFLAGDRIVFRDNQCYSGYLNSSYSTYFDAPANDAVINLNTAYGTQIDFNGTGTLYGANVSYDSHINLVSGELNGNWINWADINVTNSFLYLNQFNFQSGGGTINFTDCNDVEWNFFNNAQTTCDFTGISADMYNNTFFQNSTSTITTCTDFSGNTINTGATISNNNFEVNNTTVCANTTLAASRDYSNVEYCTDTVYNPTFIIAQADIAGITALGNTDLVTTAPTITPGIYQVSPRITINALTALNLTARLTYVNQAGNPQTIDMFPQGLTTAALTATGTFLYPSVTINTDGTAPIVIIGRAIGVSVDYDGGGTIIKYTY